MKPVRIVAALCALTLAVPAWSTAHPGQTDTFLHEAFTMATTDITPGLCAPGDTEACVGPEVAQFHVTTTDASTCVLNGLFEGESFADRPCSFDLYGFLTGVTPEAKPVCGAAFFYLSDDTTAFGEDKVSTFTFDGDVRHIYIEGYTFGTAAVFTRVAVDDDDADDDVEGDHVNVALPSPILRETGGAGTPCVSTPLSRGVLIEGTSVFV